MVIHRTLKRLESLFKPVYTKDIISIFLNTEYIEIYLLKIENYIDCW